MRQKLDVLTVGIVVAGGREALGSDDDIIGTVVHVQSTKFMIGSVRTCMCTAPTI